MNTQYGTDVDNGFNKISVYWHRHTYSIISVNCKQI